MKWILSLGIDQVACSNKHRQQCAPNCKGKTVVPHIKISSNSKEKVVLSGFLLLILFLRVKKLPLFFQKIAVTSYLNL